jgi:hypothetical protein
LNFLGIFSKKAEISNFIEIRPVGVELFHADENTDGHDEATVAFRKLATATKNKE